jgi:GGDEF domain-containing protein
VSLLLIEVGTQGNALDRQVLGQMLEAACRSIEVPEMLCELLSPYCRVLVLPACERREAVRLAEQTLASIRHMVQRFEAQGKVLHHTANAGVCSSALPPKNFSPQALVDTADRCLSAARSTGTQVVKSLEIY